MAFVPRHEDHGASMDMDMGHSHGASASASSSMHMVMTFQNTMATALYSNAWTPSSSGEYAGTIIFLIILAIIMRVLVATKAYADARWLDAEFKRRYVVVNGQSSLSEQIAADGESQKLTLTQNGVEEDVMVLQKRRTHVRPWRITVDPLRAVLDTFIAGVGYLL